MVAIARDEIIWPKTFLSMYFQIKLRETHKFSDQLG